LAVIYLFIFSDDIADIWRHEFCVLCGGGREYLYRSVGSGLEFVWARCTHL